jgi:hypothetical protein
MARAVRPIAASPASSPMPKAHSLGNYTDDWLYDWQTGRAECLGNRPATLCAGFTEAAF